MARRWVVYAQGGSFPPGVWNQIVLSWDGIALNWNKIVVNWKFFFDGDEADLPVMLQSTELVVERGWQHFDMGDSRLKFALPSVCSSCDWHSDPAMTSLHSRDLH